MVVSAAHLNHRPIENRASPREGSEAETKSEFGLAGVQDVQFLLRRKPTVLHT